MTRFLILVEIDARSPVDAELLVGHALEKNGLSGHYFVRQTQVVVREADEKMDLAGKLGDVGGPVA